MLPFRVISKEISSKTSFFTIIEKEFAEVWAFASGIDCFLRNKKTAERTGRAAKFVEAQPKIMMKHRQAMMTASDGNFGQTVFHNAPTPNISLKTSLWGSSNKMLHAASLPVANIMHIGQIDKDNYNTLFIYGNSGLGKTHLLYAIMNRISEKYPDFMIVFVKSDEFTNELIDSLSRRTTQKFRDKYRKADVLLIDDIQFIAGKESIQEEFFNTFNALYEDKKQIILTADRPPRDKPS